MVWWQCALFFPRSHRFWDLGYDPAPIATHADTLFPFACITGRVDFPCRDNSDNHFNPPNPVLFRVIFESMLGLYTARVSGETNGRRRASPCRFRFGTAFLSLLSMRE